MGGAYYNEWERFPAEWLCNLMAAGKITNGRVDQRSIKEVQGADLVDYERVHLFAGIAGWELALEQAGWPRGLPVWTGSCPCQPFSTAGKGKGVNDERHLWPEMLRLIDECRPPVIFGEQVASKAGRAWLATLRADLEALGYAVGAADLCAAGVGAPHIRQRLWWVAWLADSTMLRRTGGRGAEAVALQGERAERGGEHAEPGCTGFVSRGSEGLRGDGSTSGRLAYRSGAGLLRAEQPQDHRGSVQGGGTGYFEQDCAGESGDAASGRLAFTDEGKCGWVSDWQGGVHNGAAAGRQQGDGEPQSGSTSGRLAHPGRLGDRDGGPGAHPGAASGLQGEASERQRVRAESGERGGRVSDGGLGHPAGIGQCGGTQDGSRLAAEVSRQGCQVDPWRNPQWLPCSDGKARPTQPGIFPLAHGLPGRVGQLRAAGNAIVPQVAAVFIRSFMDAAGIE